MLIIVSVAGILITPDFADDVDGVLQRQNLAKAQMVSISSSQYQFLFPAIPLCAPVPLNRLMLSNLLDLVCVRLC
jgi:hypothetical protein